ncbi:MAG: transposase [Alphaproteobacteria bacterium]|nr:transposase [Alphaproteobacteria bacterium]
MDMIKGLMGKLIGDKGYLSKNLFQQLFVKGVTLITKIRKNMENCLMNMQDKLMLMRRLFVETIFSSIKLPFHDGLESFLPFFLHS